MRLIYLAAVLIVVISCKTPTQKQTGENFYPRELSASRSITKNGSTDSNRVATKEEFEDFLGGKFVAAAARIIAEGQGLTIEIDSIYVQLWNMGDANRFITCSVVSPDSLLFSLTGKGAKFGTDTLTAYPTRDGYSMFYYGLKIVVAGQVSAYFGYKDITGMVKAAERNPSLDSMVFYKVQMTYKK